MLLHIVQTGSEAHPVSCPHLLDLPLCDFHLFPPKWKVRTHFQSVDEVKSETADLLNRVSADDL
jgi:hypothetical protein